MREDEEVKEPHRTEQAAARRRRLAASFDRAAVNGDQALKDALEIVEELKKHEQWRPAPPK